MRAVVQTSAVALVISALIFAGTSLLSGSKSGASNSVSSSACGGPSFCITSPPPGPVLYPLASTGPNLPLTFSNPLNVPIRVNSLTVSFTNSFPVKCPSTELTLNGMTVSPLPSPVSKPGVTLTYTGTSFAVPQAVDSTPGTAVDNLTLALPDNHQNQDACKSLALVMNFSATAQYTASTTTALTATPLSPAVAGQPVTLSATVSTATVGATTPVGSVTFYSCTDGSCGSKSVLATVTPLTAGVATTTTTPPTTGTYYYEAIYTPSSSTDFLPSTSPVVVRTVNYTNACGANGKINGKLTVAQGKFVFVNCTVNGSVTVNAGGALFLQGATVNGGISSTGATALMVCGSTINGAITATGTTGSILIGDGNDDATPGCGANTISGGITLTNNTGGFEVGGNHISGSVGIAGNTGVGPNIGDKGPEVEGNTIAGSLSCTTTNVPSIANGAQTNTVSGTKSGECAGTSF